MPQNPSSEPNRKRPGSAPPPQAGFEPEEAARLDDVSSTRVIETSLASDEALAAEDMTLSRMLKKQSVVLGGYQLLRKLGEGAMGSVYLAWEEAFQRHVAIKVLFPHVANNPKLVERLYREGRAMGQLDHPNIVQAYAIGEDEGCHYVTMEYVDGANMQKWMQKLGKIPVADALQITLECAKGLSYAHRQGMVHRDIKPDNILVTRKGEVKIADLGMVKTYDEDLSLTQTGHAVGTPWYMPMEQARNAKETDGRSDIYALGCSLYAFLTGMPPFAGKTLVEVIHAKELGTVPRARQSNPEVSEKLDLVIAKMAAKHPKDRYQNCDEVIQALLKMIKPGEPISFLQKAKPTGPIVVEPASEEKASGETVVDKPNETGVVDPNLWFVRMKSAEGQLVSLRLTTDQVRAKLEDGSLKPTAKASHSADQGFRALATYKEFEGRAINKIAQKKGDQSQSKYRDIYSEFDDREKQREKVDLRQKNQHNPYWTLIRENWHVFAWVAGGFLAMLLMFWLGSVLGR